MIRRRDLLGGSAFLGASIHGRTPHRAQSPGPSPAVPPTAARPLVQSFDGPLVVTSNLDRQREMFEEVIGMTLISDQNLDEPAVQALLGLRGRTARTVLLQTKSTPVGVRLIDFRPPPALAVREGARPTDTDALKAIDFLVPDFDRALAALAGHGFRLAAPPAAYTTPEDGRLTEGHVEGPDGVVCALIQMHDTPRSKYVTVTDQTFSEILGVSAPVSDREAALRFYRETLKLETVLSYAIENASFQKMLGSKERTLLRGDNFGVSHRAPMIGVIHYGLPSSAFRSLRARSVLPHRGAQALRFTAPSVDAVARAAATAKLEIVVPVGEALLFPQGRVKSLMLRAPHGVLHHFTETLRP